MNELERNKLLGIEGLHDYASYDSADLATLEKLADAGELDLSDSQNDSPTAGEFMEFMNEHPEITAHGYVIGAGRSDKRVTIEGLEYKGKIGKPLMMALIENYRSADEFIIKDKYFYCWYD